MLSMCDIALANPQFSNPDLGKLDLRSKTFDGEATQFERYEWYVARLVYSLDVVDCGRSFASTRGSQSVF